MALNILYPNGQTQACQMYIWDIGTLQPKLWDGAVSFSGSITLGQVDQGNGGTSPWLVKAGSADPVHAWIDNAPSVGVTSSVLPTGASTSALQTTGNSSLASIDGKLANPLPVTGSFFPATQPISAVSLPLPTSASQEHTTAASPSSARLTDGAAFYTALSDTQLRASAVPTSLAALPALVAGSAIIGKVGIDQTTPGTTNGVQVNAALPAGSNAIGKLAANAGVNIGDVAVTSITPPTLTKGTQGATGFSTQDLKDAGRTAIIYYATAAASGTTGTETAITLTKASGTSATSTAVSFVVTSGKRFRIQQILVSAVGNVTATTQATTFSFRINTAGAVTTASTPIVWKGRVQTPATSLAYQQISLPIPDGYEILGDGTLQFGFTANAVFTTNAPTWDVAIIGYEY